jgi:hypothetical protein
VRIRRRRKGSGGEVRGAEVGRAGEVLRAIIRASGWGTPKPKKDYELHPDPQGEDKQGLTQNEISLLHLAAFGRRSS